jgi:hypothetical protein
LGYRLARVVRRVVAAAAALGAAFVVAPAAGAQTTLLMPGVSYEKTVEFTPHGPVVVHLMRAPRPTGLYALKPVLSNDAIVGRERVTQMQRRVATTATVAGVNGDLFHWQIGHPSGMLMMSGVLASAPNPDRSSTGIAGDGSLRVERVRMNGTWAGSGQRRPLALNRSPGSGGVALFTPSYGPATPAAAETVEVVLTPFPTAQPNVDLVGTVVQAKQGGSTPIPPGGAVLVGRGVNGAGRLATEAPVGSNVTVRLVLTPDWGGIVDAIGGGPLLVRDGRAIFRANEVFTIDQLVPRQPRSAIGQTADGGIILATVDGRRPGWSVGMTSFEMALMLRRLGAVTASGLDGGGSATMAFEGRLLNRPSDPGGERAVAESLNVFYYGVHVPELGENVVSPNGDGVAERQTFSYKIVRPSTVNARLVAPDGSQVPVDVGDRPTVGTYRFPPWTPPALEGVWRFLVDSTDDLGRASTAERAFVVNNTLSSLVVPNVRRRSTVRAGFTLSRPASVRVTILTANGAALRGLPARQLPAGAQTAAWNGRSTYGSLVRAGRYQLRITAVNDVGTVSLTAPFAITR